MRKLLICAVLLALPCAGFAQHHFYQATDMDVNGVFVGGKYTKAQVEAKWGTPTNYSSNTSEFGLNETYDYSNNQFRFSDDGVFVEFYIDIPNFVVYTTFNGGIKVGDNISRIAAIGLGTPVRQGDGTFHLNRNDSDDPLIFGHLNGIITFISFIPYI
jgi:hypothetical protein